MLLIIILGTIYFILLDELIMGCAQRRIGPFNLGHYGLLSSLINGCNLIISQYLLPKVCLHFGFQSFPILFLIFSSHCSAMLYPFFLIDLYLSIILFILLSSASLLFIIFLNSIIWSSTFYIELCFLLSLRTLYLMKLSILLIFLFD